MQKIYKDLHPEGTDDILKQYPPDIGNSLHKSLEPLA